MDREPRDYRTDDCDQETLRISMGGNGDWYLTILDEPSHKLGPTVRLTTSGARREHEHVAMAVFRLYEALGGKAPPDGLPDAFFDPDEAPLRRVAELESEVLGLRAKLAALGRLEPARIVTVVRAAIEWMRAHGETAFGVAALDAIACDAEELATGRPVGLRCSRLGFPEPLFYLVSLRWSGEHVCFWRPKSAGYTEDLNQAGKYTAKECAEQGEETLAVACPEIERYVEPAIRFVSLKAVVKERDAFLRAEERRRGPTVTEEQAALCACTCGPCVDSDHRGHDPDTGPRLCPAGQAAEDAYGKRFGEPEVPR